MQAAAQEPVEFFQSILDSVEQHIVIIDAYGKIVYVNEAWTRFAAANGAADTQWMGTSYVDVCEASAAVGESDARTVADGTRAMLEGSDGFYHEYPCHSPTEQRWFMMRASALRWDGQPAWVISHQNITERKQAEQRARSLSLTDPLTGVANRRRFDEFLDTEWRRATRSREPIALVMLDLDHFKQLNDIYGHQGGDDCLQSVGKVLAGFAKRPGDLAARYGGEEFALVLANTGMMTAARIAGALRDAIRALDIPHSGSSVCDCVTGSLGVASLVPGRGIPLSLLIESADVALYQAKQRGRNQVALSGEPAQVAHIG